VFSEGVLSGFAEAAEETLAFFVWGEKMNNRVTSGKGFKVLITLICIMLVLALITAGNSTVGGLVNGFLIAPLQRVAADFTHTAEKTVQPPKSADELAKENSELAEENRRLNDMLVEYYDLKKENEELYKFYNIKKSNEDFSVVPSTVIARDPNENFYGFVLDKGSADGVSLNDPVMTENGLVGYVSEVSIKSCKVTALISPSSQVGTVDKRTSDEGVVTGTPALCDEGIALMKNISTSNSIRSGDIIVTSGYGGLYPKNIKIGTVTKVDLDEHTGMPSAVIKPFEDARDITSAAIIVDFSGKGEIQGYIEESGKDNSKKK